MKHPFSRFAPARQWFLLLVVGAGSLSGCDSDGAPDPDSPYHVQIRLTATNVATLPVTASVERLPIARGRQAQRVPVPAAGPYTTELGPWNASEGVRLTLHYAPETAPAGGPRLPAGSALVGEILVNGQVKKTIRLDEQSTSPHPAMLSVATEVPKLVKSRGE